MPTLALAPLWACANAPVSTLERTLGGTEGPDFTRYLLVCGSLVVAIVLLGLGFRRWIGARVSARAAQRSLRVIDVLPLGPKQRLAVVRCYDRTFLLGLGDREVSLVTELDPGLGSKNEAAPSLPDSMAFAAQLARANAAENPISTAEDPVIVPPASPTGVKPPKSGWIG